MGAAGTIGLAFIGIAAALDVPLGMAAGAIVGAAYVSEIVSPLVDGPNLAAAIAEVDVFALCKRFLPLVIVLCLACTGIYAVIGFGLDTSGDAGASTAAILSGLEGSFNIGPVTLIPLVVMVVCIAFRCLRFRRFWRVSLLARLKPCFTRASMRRCFWALW